MGILGDWDKNLIGFEGLKRAAPALYLRLKSEVAVRRYALSL
jgi:hypothetical protein